MIQIAALIVGAYLVWEGLSDWKGKNNPYPLASLLFGIGLIAFALIGLPLLTKVEPLR